MNTRQVMRKILVEAREFRGFISPRFQRFRVSSGEDHNTAASRLLDKLYPNWEWWENREFTEGGAAFGTPALLSKGWVRVVGDGIYSVWELEPPATRVLNDLIAELPDETPVTVDIESGSRRGIRTSAGEWDR